MSNIALITGITGQDGSYLAELLLSKQYKVHGLIRRTSTHNTSRIDHIIHDLVLHTGDLTDQASLIEIVDKIRPTEIYNLAAQSFVQTSWTVPIATTEVTAIGVTKILEAIKTVDRSIKFYQASSSEMFGKAIEIPQSETTPFHPRSPYGVAKTYGHYITQNYRESYGIFGVCGILFNHESQRRGLEFVTRKITNSVAKIKAGCLNQLLLGNLYSKRDWGHAQDYVYAMWLMLQQKEPQDFVIGTGKPYSVLDFVQTAFKRVDLDYRKYVKVDQKLYRPAEVDILCADITKARRILNWKPKISFEELVAQMVDYDLCNIEKIN